MGHNARNKENQPDNPNIHLCDPCEKSADNKNHGGVIKGYIEQAISPQAFLGFSKKVFIGAQGVCHIEYMDTFMTPLVVITLYSLLNSTGEYKKRRKEYAESKTK